MTIYDTIWYLMLYFLSFKKIKNKIVDRSNLMRKIYYEDEILGQINVSGIGKFVITTMTEWNIPNLHYITYFSESDKTYYALCLELGIQYSSQEHGDELFQGIINSSLEYLNHTIIEKEDMDKLVKLVKHIDFEDFWSLYRQTEFELAKEGRDISNQFMKKIEQNAIEKFVKERFYSKNIEFARVDQLNVA